MRTAARHGRPGQGHARDHRAPGAPAVRDAGGPGLGDGADPGSAARASGLTPAEREPPLETGEAVTLREVWHGRVVAARPLRVVEDLPDRHRAFWFVPGTHWMNDPRHDGEVRFLDGTWELEPLVRERGVLSFAFPDSAYGVLMNTDDEGRFTGYYVNIQSPLHRWDGGFDYVDWFLDVRI